MIRPPDAVQPRPLEVVSFATFTQQIERQNGILSAIQAKLEGLSERMAVCERRIDDLSKKCLPNEPTLSTLPPQVTLKRKDQPEPALTDPVQLTKTLKNDQIIEEIKINPLPVNDLKELIGETTSRDSIEVFTKSTRITNENGDLLCVFIRNAIDFVKHELIFGEMDKLCRKKIAQGSTLRGHAARKI